MDQPKKAICVDSLDEKMAKKFKKAIKVRGCTSRIQLTRSSKPPGFINP
jgi:hypothetical protein